MDYSLTWISAALVPLLLVQVVSYLQSPLRSVPGPLLAKFTNLWRFFDVWSGKADVTQQKLHAKYGRYVRLGPNVLSTTDPRAINDLYASRNAQPKSDWYAVGDFMQNGQRIESQFSTRNEAWHTRTMKPIIKLFSMNSILEYEYLMNTTIETLLEELNRRFVDKKPCDTDNWMHYYAWDVIGQVTFSKTMGFLKQGNDIQNLLRAGCEGFDYMSVIGQIPWLDYLFDKNRLFRIGPPGFTGLLNFTGQELFGRMNTPIEQKGPKPDFLDRFISTKETDPDVVDDARVFSYTFINTGAGSDTTAITLRAVIYFTLRHPDVQHRLEQEIRNANLAIPAAWKAVQPLSYLDAVIKESMRLHPAVGLLLERRIDQRGLTMPNGLYLPPGTIVGINPATIHRDREVYGTDVDDFRPERWLMSDDEVKESYEARRAAMDKANLTFGHGTRGCLGRHVAILEVYKVIATLFATYDMKLTHPEREWKTRDSWFNRQWDMDVDIRSRTS